MKSRRQKKARSRRQQLFLAWLDENASRFRIPIRIGKRTDSEIKFTFPGLPPNLHGVVVFDQVSVSSSDDDRSLRLKRLSRGEIMVYADWKEENYDVILELDAYPVNVAAGYVCYECLQEHRIVFPSREALWQDHLFAPFLRWINTELAEASALAFYGQPDQTTWVKLIKPGDPPDSDRQCDVVPLTPCRDR